MNEIFLKRMFFYFKLKELQDARKTNKMIYGQLIPRLVNSIENNSDFGKTIFKLVTIHYRNCLDEAKIFAKCVDAKMG